MYSYDSTPGKCYDAQTPKHTKKRYETIHQPLDTTLVDTSTHLLHHKFGPPQHHSHASSSYDVVPICCGSVATGTNLQHRIGVFPHRCHPNVNTTIVIASFAWSTKYQ